MKKIICDAIKNNSLCEIYTDTAKPEIFSVGYFVNCDDDNVLIKAYDQYGKSDGLWCYKIDAIFCVKQDTKYLSDILKLINYYNTQCDLKFNCDKSILKSYLQFIKNKKLICSLELGNDCFAVECGFIDEIIEDEEANYVKIYSLDTSAQNDGIATIYLDDIHYVSCGSLDDIKLKVLFDLKSSK